MKLRIDYGNTLACIGLKFVNDLFSNKQTVAILLHYCSKAKLLYIFTDLETQNILIIFRTYEKPVKLSVWARDWWTELPRLGGRLFGAAWVVAQVTTFEVVIWRMSAYFTIFPSQNFSNIGSVKWLLGDIFSFITSLQHDEDEKNLNEEML